MSYVHVYALGVAKDKCERDINMGIMYANLDGAGEGLNVRNARVETFFGIWLRICRKFIYKMVMHGSITADRYWNGARHKIYIYFFHVYSILNIYFWGCFSFIFSICHFLFLHINIHTS